MAGKTNCDFCANYVYDDYEEYYHCLVNLDEDEMQNFLKASVDNCPYFRADDEYKIVRKQM